MSDLTVNADTLPPYVVPHSQEPIVVLYEDDDYCSRRHQAPSSI